MKSIFAIVLLALSFTASAARINANSSWAQIMRSSQYKAQFPQARFLGGSVFKSVYGVCHATNDDGVEVLRGGMYEKCVRWSHRRDDSVCEETQAVMLETTRTYTSTVCDRWGGGRDNDNCQRSRTVTSKYPLSYDVSVYRVSGDRDDTNLAFKKNFTIPACE